MREPWSGLKDVGIATAVALVLAQVVGVALLVALAVTETGHHFGIDLRGSLSVELRGSPAHVAAVIDQLAGELDGFARVDSNPVEVRFRATGMEDLGPLAEVAERHDVQVGSFGYSPTIVTLADSLRDGDADDVLGIVCLLTLPLPLALFFVGRARRRRLSIRTCPLQRPVTMLLSGIGIGLVAVAGAWGLASALAQFGLEVREQAVVLALLDGGPVARTGLFVFAVVFAPLGEEMFFRGFVFERLRGRMPRSAAYAISAVLFAAIHFNPSAVPLYLMLGLVLAWAYERTGQITVPAIAHGVHNAVVLAIAA